MNEQQIKKSTLKFRTRRRVGDREQGAEVLGRDLRV